MLFCALYLIEFASSSDELNAPVTSRKKASHAPCPLALGELIIPPTILGSNRPLKLSLGHQPGTSHTQWSNSQPPPCRRAHEAAAVYAAEYGDPGWVHCIGECRCQCKGTCVGSCTCKKCECYPGTRYPMHPEIHRLRQLGIPRTLDVYNSLKVSLLASSHFWSNSASVSGQIQHLALVQSTLG